MKMDGEEAKDEMIPVVQNVVGDSTACNADVFSPPSCQQSWDRMVC